MKSPYDGTQLLLADAWRRGYAARRARQPFRCPLSSYVKSFTRAWEEGWRAADEVLEAERIAGLRDHVPDVRAQEPPIRPR